MDKPSVGECAVLACLLEVMAPKPGNVHRAADFADTTLGDFAVSAVAIRDSMEAARQTGVGRAVMDAIVATRNWTASNTNLGMVLLLAPLAAVPEEESLVSGTRGVLDSLQGEDSRLVYESIRLASPGGLGEVQEMDVQQDIPHDLIAAMKLAESYDMVARQYARAFEDVFSFVLPKLQRSLDEGRPITDAIVRTHVATMAEFPDTLIQRKCGADVANESAARARKTLECLEGNDESAIDALADLDFWLRSDDNRRNPGTTADLIAAGLFCGLREGTIRPPFSF